MEANTTAQGMYRKLSVTREPFLSRARECSLLTIPSIMPEEGHTGSTDLVTPYQSLGARGVNNLASKLLLSLLPPNTPFFKLQIDDFTLEELTQQEGMRAKVEEALGSIERTVMSEIDARAMRVSLFESLKHLIVTGNGLIYVAPTGELRVFHLDRFVVRRDSMGNILDIITHEEIAFGALPDNVKEVVVGEMNEEEDFGKNVSLYTHVRWNGTQWEVYQEVKGKIIEDSRGTYPKDKSPWIPIRWSKIDGEDYGRGYVEEYLGDLKTLEGLNQAIVEGSAAAAKLLFLVNPNGTTDAADLASAENGAFVQGMEQDVSVLRVEKMGDFRTAREVIVEVGERLAFAFLLNSAVQRTGERVTAEEIRFMARELEDALGGIYSILSQELQLPLVNRVMFQMERGNRVPKLPKGTVKPVIVAGFEALGRGQDLGKLQQFIGSIAQFPEAIGYINTGDLIKRIGVSLGIDMKGLVKTDEQLQQEQQQAQMAQAMQAGIPNAVGAAGRIMEKGMENGGQQAQ